VRITKSLSRWGRQVLLLHLNLAWLALGKLRQLDGQDAIFVAGGDLFLIDPLVEIELSFETAKAALAIPAPVFFLLALRLLFALDGQNIVLDVNLDFLLAHPRQLGLDQITRVFLFDL